MLQVIISVPNELGDYENPADSSERCQVSHSMWPQNWISTSLWRDGHFLPCEIIYLKLSVSPS